MALVLIDESKVLLKKFEELRRKVKSFVRSKIITERIASLINQTTMMKNIWKSNLIQIIIYL